MSLTALVAYSAIYGWNAERRTASSIKNRDEARELGLLYDLETRDPVFWVGRGSRRAHFRRYKVKDRGRVLKYLNKNKSGLTSKIRRRSTIHDKVQECLVSALTKLIGSPSCDWWRKGAPISDFSLSGNLLSDVKRVVPEYTISSPFYEGEYIADIALLGEDVFGNPIVFGVIEIEDTHAAEFLKITVCKSLGFPVITLDIQRTPARIITEAWCMQRLLETTVNSRDGGRRNNIYIHNLLYPVFISDPAGWQFGNSHDYYVFMRNEDELTSLHASLLKYLIHPDLIADIDLKVHRLDPDTDSSVEVFRKAHDLVGSEIKEYNSNSFIRINLKRPVEKKGPLYIFHLQLTQMLALKYDCLVGYELEASHTNNSPFCMVTKRNPDGIEEKKFCLKRVSEPLRKIMEVLPDQLKKA